MVIPWIVLAVCAGAAGRQRDYYSVLGIPRTATSNQIKKAYRDLALKHHPDKNPNHRDEAQRKFREVAEAYEVLSDKQRRKQYDASQSYASDRDSPSGFKRQSFRSADDIFKEFFGTNDPFANFDAMFRDGLGGSDLFDSGVFGMNNFGSTSFVQSTTTVGQNSRSYSETVRTSSEGDGGHASGRPPIGSSSFIKSSTTFGPDGHTYTKISRSYIGVDGRTSRQTQFEEAIHGDTTPRVDKSSVNPSWRRRPRYG